MGFCTKRIQRHKEIVWGDVSQEVFIKNKLKHSMQIKVVSREGKFDDSGEKRQLCLNNLPRKAREDETQNTEEALAHAIYLLQQRARASAGEMYTEVWKWENTAISLWNKCRINRCHIPLCLNHISGNPLVPWCICRAF